jgi:putative ABC transport system permease protein
MFKNYFKIALRNIKKNKLYSIISILGLALAIGCFTLPFVVVDFNHSIDKFHKHGDKIYYMLNNLGKSGGGKLCGFTPRPLGPALKHDFPQVADYVRIDPELATIKINDKIFRDTVYFVDDGFLAMFTFPIISGDKNALSHRNSIIITEEGAKRYFGEKNPIDKEIIITNEKEFREPFIVKGVVKTPTELSSLQFDILVSYKKLIDWKNADLNDWESWAYTLIRLKNKKDIAPLVKHPMDNYIRMQNKVNNSWPVQSFLFEPLYDLSKHTRQISGDLGRAGFPPETMISLWSFGIMILMLACFNFINIGIVTSTRRLKEIGIRKVLGSNRLKLITQFLGEHILICLLAIAAGVIFVRSYIIPFYTGLFPSLLKLDFLQDFKIWIFYGITFLITLFGSGGYPALYVSRFKPVNILNKTQKVGGSMKMTKIFLAFQFVLTFLMIGMALIFIQNAKFQENIDWGYNQENVINVSLKEKTQYEVYKNTIAQNPDIINISGSKHLIGRSWDSDTVEYHGEEYAIPAFVVGYDYLDTLQVQFKKGRNFDRGFATDDRAIIINEKFAQTLGWENSLNQRVVIANCEYSVIGVIADFYNQPFTEPVKPALFRLGDPGDYRYLSARVQSGKVIQSAKFLENTWKQLFPNKLYEAFYQNEIWVEFFSVNEGIYKLTIFCGLIALLISCVGLFGLLSISIVKRTKEISIRKVLGASISNIIQLLSGNILKIMVISSIIGAPLCYFFTVSLLDSYFSIRTPMTLTPFLIASFILISTSILTVLSQILNTARMNIVDRLRAE